MMIHLDAESLETLLKGVRSRLTVVSCENNAAYIEPYLGEYVKEADNVDVVCNAKVASDLVLLDVVGVDDNDYLRIVLQLEQHLELTVGLEAGQDSRSVIIVKELSSELKIKLIAELSDTLSDVLRLHFQVFFVVKSDFSTHLHVPPVIISLTIIYQSSSNFKYPIKKTLFPLQRGTNVTAA